MIRPTRRIRLIFPANTGIDASTTLGSPPLRKVLALLLALLGSRAAKAAAARLSGA
jgi:hypothetical protein